MSKFWKVPFKSHGFVIIQAEDQKKALDEAEGLLTKSPIGFMNLHLSEPELSSIGEPPEETK